MAAGRGSTSGAGLRGYEHYISHGAGCRRTNRERSDPQQFVFGPENLTWRCFGMAL
jgi:hypothetical protein